MRLKASVTIFLSLVITVVIVVVCTVIESARISVSQMEGKAATYMAVESVFAGYGKQLYQDYGILLAWEQEPLGNQVTRYMQDNINMADLDFKNVNINNVFSEIYKTLKERLDSKNIDLIINNQLENIYGDETLIIMCVSNLVKNAINVSDVNSKIIINALKINDKKYIQVVDYGPGISKENIAKITEPFYRVDKVRSRKNGGAGLGLSICKSIMELHKGDLKIESDIGKGSIFILEFPE